MLSLGKQNFSTRMFGTSSSNKQFTILHFLHVNSKMYVGRGQIYRYIIWVLRYIRLVDIALTAAGLKPREIKAQFELNTHRLYTNIIAPNKNCVN